jgi:hypothetical protein
MLDLPEEKSSLILTEDGALMEAVLSLEKIHLKSIEVLLMLLDGLLNLLLLINYAEEFLFKLLILLELLILSVFILILMVL